MNLIKHNHSHLTPFNGAFYTKDGQLHNLDGAIGANANGSNMVPFCGVYLDSNGNPQDITDILNGMGGGGGGISLAQLNAAIAAEATLRQNADVTEITNRNTAITNAINQEVIDRNTAITNAIATEITNRNTAITNAIATEVTNRNTAIATAIAAEIIARDAAIVTAFNNYDLRVFSAALNGATLTRVINGTTNVANNLFPNFANMVAGKCIINDSTGTIGIYESIVNAATISIRTITIDTIGGSGAAGPILLGNVPTETDLPATVTAGTTLFGYTPKVDDYARVLVDSTNGNHLVEYYITAIDGSGNITWGNEIIINTADYQSQSTTSDAGKVLVGGATAGTFGTSLGFDTTPTQNSTNLVNSGNLWNTINPIISATNALDTRVTALENGSGSGNVSYYKEIIDGDGVTTSFKIQHDLGTDVVSVEVYDITSVNKERVFPDILNNDTTDADFITITFGVAPVVNQQYLVVVLGPSGITSFKSFYLPPFQKMQSLILGNRANNFLINYDAQNTIFTNLPTNNSEFIGGVVFDEHQVLLIPNNASQFAILNDLNGDIISFGSSDTTTDKYAGGVLLSNGKILAIPSSASQPAIIDPITKTVTYFGLMNSSASKYYGGVSLDNGKVLTIPYNSPQPAIIDPIAKTITPFGPIDNMSGKYKGGVLLLDGRVIGIPYNASQPILIDPLAQTVTPIGTSDTTQMKYSGGVLLPDGVNVLAIPFSASQIMMINSVTNTTSLVGPSNSTFGKYSGGVLLTDGRILLVPSDNPTVDVYNPSTQSLTSIIGSNTISNKYAGGYLMSDGNILLVPSSLGYALSISASNGNYGILPALEITLDPHFNKF